MVTPIAGMLAGLVGGIAAGGPVGGWFGARAGHFAGQWPIEAPQAGGRSCDTMNSEAHRDKRHHCIR